MISIKAISNSGSASQYFKESDYYTKESDGGVVSEWNGKGAHDLKLSGAVDTSTFKDLMDGKLPDGQQLGRATKTGEVEHAKGWDLTFSAPKSVSVMALVAGDKRLIDAHQAAVKTAMGFAEKHFVKTRVTENGVTRQEATGNAVFASFLHKTSRALDPQLHTHNPLINATKSLDGKWRSIDSKAIYENSMAIGGVYKMELASLVKQLGYETEKGKHGNIEIKGVDKELMDSFSKRRQEILKAKEEFGYSTAKGMDKAAVRTRAAKQDASPQQLQQQWGETSKEHTGKLASLIKEARQYEQTKPSTSFDKSIIDSAVKNLTERNASFTHTDLVKEVHRWSDAKYSIDVIEKNIDKALSSKQLHKGTVKGVDGYTTPAQVKLEKNILRTVGAGINKMKPFATEVHVASKVESSGLNKGQADAFSLMMTTKDGYVGVQGFAGTGKTYLLDTYREAMESKGKQVMGFAWTHNAVSILQKESNIESRTVMRLVSDINNGKTEAYSKLDSMILDEASMVGAKPMSTILKFAADKGIKVTMLGDKLQNESIDWGKPFEQLTQNGMKTAMMKEIMRQKDSPNLLSAVHSLIGRSPSKAFAYIKDNVHEVDSVEKRKSLMVDKVISMPKEQRDYHLLLIPDNATRSEVNDRIQQALVDKGELSGNSASVNALANVGYTDVEKGHAQFYEQGYKVVFNGDFKSLGVKKNDMLSVKSSDKQYVTLVNSKDDEIKWEPSKVAGRSGKVEVYKPQDKKFHEGEEVRSTRTNKEKELKIGLQGIVSKVDQDLQKLTITDKNGREHSIGFNDAIHWDLKYATTVYSSQGATVKDVTLHLESKRVNLTNLKTAYVGVTRSKGNVDIYVDNHKKVTDALFHRSGSSVSALDAKGIDPKAEINYGSLSLTEKIREKLRSAIGMQKNSPINKTPQQTQKLDQENPKTPEVKSKSHDIEIER